MRHIYLGINGACGRMGRRLIALAARDPELHVSLAVDAAEHPDLGRDAGELAGIEPLGLPVVSTVPHKGRVDVLIDFSTPDGTMAVLGGCVSRQIPILVATTGHTVEQRREINEAAHETAVLQAANTSLAVAVLAALVREAAGFLQGKGFDVEIIERHHRQKKDSPSGTALQIAHAIQHVWNVAGVRHGREGHVGEKPVDEIGIHAVRSGDNFGEHSVIFAGAGELLEITQRATTRDCYVRGALQAAKFLAGKGPGKYSMSDVLGV
jgi:4-hydroxy-tetrahydrodipicolinate reductase